MRFRPGDDVYTVMDTLGRIVFATPDFEEACAHADRMTGGAWQLLAPTPEEEAAEEDYSARRAANGRRAPALPLVAPSRGWSRLGASEGETDGAAFAMKAGGLKEIPFEAVRDMSLAEAYRAVLPILEEQAGARRRAEPYRPFDVMNVCRILCGYDDETGKCNGVAPSLGEFVERYKKAPGGKAGTKIKASIRVAAQAALDRIKTQIHPRALGAAIQEDIASRQANTKIQGAEALTAPVSGLLGENAKLSKVIKDQGRETVALGLSFLPEHAAFTGESAAGVSIVAPKMEDRHAVSTTQTKRKSFVDNTKFSEGPVEGMEPVPAPIGPRGRSLANPTLCAFASAECKATCLVYSGQNQADVINNYAKMARAKMFLEQPVAFLRLLAHAILKFAQTSNKSIGVAGHTSRFVRLNVFQDIPWEIVAPWIFDLTNDLPSAQRIRFYDYTKVPGRPAHPNYHLSYSYAGGKGSMALCNSEFEQGRNVVIVFGSLNYKTGGAAGKFKLLSGKPAFPTDEAKKKAFTKINPLPIFFSDPGFMGGAPIPVEDGDKSDIRPLDPRGVVVGLRWKPPMLGGYDRKDAAQYYNAFVVKGKVMHAPGSPEQRLYVIYGNTPMSQPITKAPTVREDGTTDEGHSDLMDQWVEWSKQQDWSSPEAVAHREKVWMHGMRGGRMPRT